VVHYVVVVPRTVVLYLLGSDLHPLVLVKGLDQLVLLFLRVIVSMLFIVSILGLRSLELNARYRSVPYLRKKENVYQQA